MVVMEPEPREARAEAAQSLSPIIRLKVGLGVLVLCLGLGVWLLAHTDGHLLRMHEVAFLVLVALATGIPIWAFSPEPSELNLKRLGLRLTGGAAVGAGFMLLAWSLSGPALSTDVVVSLSRSYKSYAFYVSSQSSSLVNVQLLPPSYDRAYIEFRMDEEIGWFKIRRPNEDLTAFVDDHYKVNRAGYLKMFDQ